jgi:hypothetical protein
MFRRRSLPEDLAAVRATHAPDAVTLDVDSDADTLNPAAAEDLGLFVDALDPATYPTEWLPDDAPTVLRRYAGGTFTVGLPGDGTVAWTRQTDPPVVLVKSRASETPEGFRDFLIAEAFVRAGTGAPESFLPFFGERYRELDATVPLAPTGVYQLARALYDGWLGLRTRDDLAALDGRLFDAWVDAGERLEPRLDGLAADLAHGRTSFPEATELACAAIKHAAELPAPFAALDTAAYVEYGADYAVRWAERTLGEDGSDDE